MRDTRYGIRYTGYEIRDTRCRIRDAGYEMRDATVESDSGLRHIFSSARNNWIFCKNYCLIAESSTHDSRLTIHDKIGHMKHITFSIILCFAITTTFSQTASQKFEFVDFSKVNITDKFWKPKIDKVATVTMRACIDQTEVKTPRIRNFEKVARNKGEKHEGLVYDDSDVYKALEAMAYALKTHPDA